MSAGIDTMLAALADPARRHVVEALAAGPRCAGALAASAGLPAPAMSRHLRVLLDAGLLEDERDRTDARRRVFRLHRRRLRELSRWLADVERAWESQLDAFSARAERGRR